jgi:hypothetical protein
VISQAHRLALALGVALAACSPALPPGAGAPSAGVPIERIASGEINPVIGLGAPFPSWAPLPERGWVTGAEVLRPQPPWGASAVIMMRIDESYDAFTAGYRRRLAERGFTLKPIPIQPNLVIDAPLAQFEAKENSGGGHVVYVTYRGDRRARYVQLTYWSPPSPPLMVR